MCLLEIAAQVRVLFPDTQAATQTSDETMLLSLTVACVSSDSSMAGVPAQYQYGASTVRVPVPKDWGVVVRHSGRGASTSGASPAVARDSERSPKLNGHHTCRHVSGQDSTYSFRRYRYC